MSTAPKLSRQSMLPKNDLERLVCEPDSGIVKIRQEVHIALHPRFLNNLNLGLLNYFNKQVNLWNPQLNGILAGYGKLQLKSPHGTLINEEAHVHLDVLSEFWVFRPEVGTELRGVVTKKSPSHISCLVHDIFTVACHKPPGKTGKSWAADVELNSPVKVLVMKTDMSQKVPFILGSLIGTVPGAPAVGGGLVDVLDEQSWNLARGGGSPSPRGKRAKNTPKAPMNPPPTSNRNGAARATRGKRGGKTAGSVAAPPTVTSNEPVVDGAGAKKRSKMASVAPAVLSIAVLPQQPVAPTTVANGTHMNIQSMLSCLAPVPRSGKKSKKRRSLLPNNIAQVVDSVVNMNPGGMPQAPAAASTQIPMCQRPPESVTAIASTPNLVKNPAPVNPSTPIPVTSRLPPPVPDELQCSPSKKRTREAGDEEMAVSQPKKKKKKDKDKSSDLSQSQVKRKKRDKDRSQHEHESLVDASHIIKKEKKKDKNKSYQEDQSFPDSSRNIKKKKNEDKEQIPPEQEAMSEPNKKKKKKKHSYD